MTYKPRLDHVIAFTTKVNLASGASFVSSVLDMRGYSQVQTHVNSSHDGTMVFDFYSDSGGTDLVRSLTVPYATADGFRLLSAPAFSDYVKYTFTNDVGATTTDFLYETKLLHNSLSGQVLALDSFVSPAMAVNLTRSVIVGEDGAGTMNNVTTTETTNDAGTYTNLNVVSGARPSQLSGRAKVSTVLDSSASHLHYTVTANKTLYITDISFTVENTLKTASGRLNIRDGTTIAGAITLPVLVQEAPTSESAITMVHHSFNEPLEFTTGMYFEINSGTINMAGVIIGYEE